MGQPLSLVVYGSFLGKTSERFVVKKGTEVLEEIPFFRVSEIIIPSKGASISADALHEAVTRGIRVAFLGSTGSPWGLLSSASLVATVEIRRAQLAAESDERSVEFGRAVVEGKLRNQARLLKYFNKYIAETDGRVLSRVEK